VPSNNGHQTVVRSHITAPVRLDVDHRTPPADSGIYDTQEKGVIRNITHQCGQQVGGKVGAKRGKIRNQIHNRDFWDQFRQAEQHLPNVEAASAKVRDKRDTPDLRHPKKNRANARFPLEAS
jgi:hypothetical protein